jgi:hypothetical protein
MTLTPKANLHPLDLGFDLLLEVLLFLAQFIKFPLHCPGRKPAFLVYKRPARPHKSAIENLFT